MDELQRVQANVETLQSTVADPEGLFRACNHTISQLQMLTEAPIIPENPAPAPSNTYWSTRTTTLTERIPDPGKFNGNCS